MPTDRRSASRCRLQYREWAPARFFYVRIRLGNGRVNIDGSSEQRHMTALQADIERRLATSEPEVEVLLAEVVGGRRLRVFIDHPQGVTLAL